ncbi:MAG: hypothetical protein K6L81_01290 [Agarilytica sp.]
MNITRPSTTLTAMCLCMLAAIVFYKTQMPQGNKRQQIPTQELTAVPSISQDRRQLALAFLTSKQTKNLPPQQTTKKLANLDALQHPPSTTESSQSEKPHTLHETSSPFDVLPIQSPASQRRTSHLEEALLSEEYDGEWAPEREINARNIFRQAALKDSDLTETECRTTLCRITITHNNATAEKAFYSALAPKLQDQHGKLVRQKNDDGRISTVIYQFR